MIEIVLIVGLFLIARNLRCAARQPQRYVAIHVYHHLVPGPGEIMPHLERKHDNVIPFHAKIQARSTRR